MNNESKCLITSLTKDSEQNNMDNLIESLFVDISELNSNMFFISKMIKFPFQLLVLDSSYFLYITLKTYIFYSIILLQRMNDTSNKGKKYNASIKGIIKFCEINCKDKQRLKNEIQDKCEKILKRKIGSGPFAQKTPEDLIEELKILRDKTIGHKDRDIAKDKGTSTTNEYEFMKFLPDEGLLQDIFEKLLLLKETMHKIYTVLTDHDAIFSFIGYPNNYEKTDYEKTDMDEILSFCLKHLKFNESKNDFKKRLCDEKTIETIDVAEITEEKLDKLTLIKDADEIISIRKEFENFIHDFCKKYKRIMSILFKLIFYILFF